MMEREIILIADKALFDLGLSVGFGAAIGVLLAIGMFKAAEMLWDGVVGIFRNRPSDT